MNKWFAFAHEGFTITPWYTIGLYTTTPVGIIFIHMGTVVFPGVYMGSP